jgi:hypothetical protein
MEAKMNKSYRLILLFLLFFASTTKPMIQRAKFIFGTTAIIGVVSVGYHIWKNYWLGRNLESGIHRGIAPLRQAIDNQTHQIEELQSGQREMNENVFPFMMEKLQLLEITSGTNRTMLKLLIKMQLVQLTPEQRNIFLASIEGMELSEEIRELFRIAVPN